MTCYCKVNVDGASSGNPGPAAIAYVIRRGDETFSYSKAIGVATNNIAEYLALLEALSKALDIGCEEVAVFSDSELLVKQLKGEYRVLDEELLKLFRRVKELEAAFKRVEYRHVSRKENEEADKLAKRALKLSK